MSWKLRKRYFKRFSDWSSHLQIGQIGRWDGTELLLKSFLVYHSPIFEAWNVLKRPAEVSCDVTQHLVEYRTAIGTRTNILNSQECVHIPDDTHGCPACIHYFFAPLVARSVQKSYRNWRRHSVTLLCTKATLHRLLEGFSFPNLPNILGKNFSISTSTPGRLISESKFWWEFPFQKATYH